MVGYAFRSVNPYFQFPEHLRGAAQGQPIEAISEAIRPLGFHFVEHSEGFCTLRGQSRQAGGAVIRVFDEFKVALGTKVMNQTLHALAGQPHSPCDLGNGLRSLGHLQGPEHLPAGTRESQVGTQSVTFGHKSAAQAIDLESEVDQGATVWSELRCHVDRSLTR